MGFIRGRLASLLRPNSRLAAPARARLELNALEHRYAPALLTVNTTADTSNGALLSLRDAINATNNGSSATFAAGQITGTFGSNDTIVFDPAVFVVGSTITVNSALSALTKAVTIDGGGTGRVTVNGNALGSDLSFNAGVTANVTGMILMGGSAAAGGGINNAGTLTVTNTLISGNNAGNGGGINNATTGTLTVVNCIIDTNTTNAGGSGGGINNAGAGTVTVTGGTFSNNTASSLGGAIFNAAAGKLSVTGTNLANNKVLLAGGSGGAVFNSGTATLMSSTLATNSAGFGGGLVNNGTLTLANSAVTSNVATSGTGGGIRNANSGTLTVTNSTFAGNTAVGTGSTTGGAIFNANTATLTLINSTIVGNTASGGITNATWRPPRGWSPAPRRSRRCRPTGCRWATR